MKKVYFIVGIIILTGIIYYTGLYTYFVRTEVQEAPPLPSLATSQKVLAIGSFGEIDFIHKGSGYAKLIEVGDKKFLRFENFEVVNGPDLYVYLSKSASPTGKIESLGDYIDLGRLKGTIGNQNYELPQNINGYKTAIVWCKRYGVLFTYAVMQ
ncbi:MAG TPA: DM13 domain-containing protein [Candidatus Paceibacterota bacterium]|nr:DM13 domain-containing protein [Candidatus Paceibacterota bacterium]